MESTEKAMDLLYSSPGADFVSAVEEMGGEIRDASDYVHTERVEVYYPREKKEEYVALLEKHDQLPYSMNIRMAALT